MNFKPKRLNCYASIVFSLYSQDEAISLYLTDRTTAANCTENEFLCNNSVLTKKLGVQWS